jgi:hypothetical protein
MVFGRAVVVGRVLVEWVPERWLLLLLLLPKTGRFGVVCKEGF